MKKQRIRKRNPEYQRLWREKHKAKGLCGRCSQPAIAGKGLCERHQIDADARLKKHNNERLSKGLCRLCGLKPVVPGKQLCEEHLEYQRKHSSNFRKKSLSEGLCYKCGKEREVDSPTQSCKKCSEILNNETNKKNKLLKKRIIDEYGGKCVCCGESEESFLSIDHIFNDGNMHRKEVYSGGLGMYKWLEKNNYPKDKFQLLCFNCNLGKRINGGICPHKMKEKNVRS